MSGTGQWRSSLFSNADANRLTVCVKLSWRWGENGRLSSFIGRWRRYSDLGLLDFGGLLRELMTGEYFLALVGDLRC